MVEVTEALQQEIAALAKEAGALILSIRSAGLNPQSKQDNTPVTEADKAADCLISAALQKYHLPVVSEEGGHLPDPGSLPDWFWLVDPLDGTRGFIRGGANFTVNIALIQNKKPVFGVIYSPVHDVLYIGAAGAEAYSVRESSRTPIRISQTSRFSALISSYHCKNEQGILQEVFPGIVLESKSSSIKFCHVAEGLSRLYFRIGETSEWDTAAGQAIVEAAGGAMRAYPSGKPFTYAKPHYRNSGVIAGDPEMVDRVIENVKRGIKERI